MFSLFKAWFIMFTSSFVPCLLAFLFVLFPTSTQAHSNPYLDSSLRSIVIPVGEYLAHCDYTIEPIYAHDLVEFYVFLDDKNTGQTIDISSVTMTVEENGRELYSIPIWGGVNSEAEKIGLVFPKKGDYVVSFRYKKDGKTIAQAALPPITVSSASFDAGASRFFDVTMGAVLGILIMYFGQIILARRRE